MIRTAEISDLSEILAIYASAREFMRKSGNPGQWGDSHPPREMLEDDIAKKRLYIIESGTGDALGCFALIGGDDPTYAVIEGGAWSSDAPYGTIHRIASNGRARGVFAECVAFAREKYDYLRVDTHRANIPMQRAIAAQGFKYCGIIYVEDGSPRLAYDLAANAK